MKVKLLVDRALDFRRGRIEIGNTKLRPNRISQRTPKLTAINELPDWAIANIVNVWEIDVPVEVPAGAPSTKWPD